MNMDTQGSQPRTSVIPPRQERTQPQPSPQSDSKRRRLAYRSLPSQSTTGVADVKFAPVPLVKPEAAGCGFVTQSELGAQSWLAADRQSDSSSPQAPFKPVLVLNPGVLSVALSSPHVPSQPNVIALKESGEEHSKIAAATSKFRGAPKAAGDEWGTLTSKLSAALEYFSDNRSKPSFQQWHQIDPALDIAPLQLVGRHVRVFWPDDIAWYLGRVTSYNAISLQHQVEYEDGESESVLMAAEEVRLLMTPCEQLLPPSPDELLSAAHAVTMAATEAEASLALQSRATAVQSSVAAAMLDALRRRESVAAAAAAAAAAALSDADAGSDSRTRESHSDSATQSRSKSTDVARRGSQPARQQILFSEEAPQKLTTATTTAAAAAAALSKVPATAATGGPRGGKGKGSKSSRSGGGRGSGRRMSSGMAAAAKQDEGAYLPGEVVWCGVKGWCHWPALVVTHLRLDDLKAPAQRGATVPLVFFGTMELMRARRPSIIRFGSGLTLRLTAKCRRSVLSFRSALSEVLAYLSEGELPDGPMLPDHMDDPFLDEDSDEEAVGNLVTKTRPVAAVADGDVSLPLRLGKHLQGRQLEWMIGEACAHHVSYHVPNMRSSSIVVSLGGIEWLHPGFHDERYLWPRGYAADRVAATAASEGKPVTHRCEVLAAPDGSGPLFRVTPRGSRAVEARTATAAWSAALLSTPAEAGGGSRGSRGRACGGSISSMSGAKAFGFSHPAVAARLRLLPGAQRCERYCGWAEGMERPPTLPLTAEESQQRAASSARMQRLPDGIAEVVPPQHGTTCHVCDEEDETEDNNLLQCDSCQVLVHQTCYGVAAAPNGRLWLCDVCDLGLNRPPPCCLCPVIGGALKATTCDRWAHMACALWSPDPVGMESGGSRLDGIEQVSRARRTLLCTLCRQQHGACIQCAGSANCYVAFHPLCARGARHVTATVDADDGASEISDGYGPSGGAKTKTRRVRLEGSCAGDGVRRLCFCPRHSAVGRQLAPISAFSPSKPPQPPAEGGTAAWPEMVPPGRMLPLPTAAITIAAVGAEGDCPGSDGSCGRALPFDSALQRGLRAPDLAAIAIAKRVFLRPIPYVVSCRNQSSAIPIPRSRSFHLEADLERARCVCYRQPLETAQEANRVGHQWGCGRLLCSRVGNPPCSRRVVSQAQRYHEMVESLHSRVTAGKSAIHGYGAFAKVAHKVGDMVVEYVGQMVRRSVVGIREAREYNDACGAGTYVFGCSGGLCVDATVAGGIAHLLNHCCAPNCISRLITIQDGDSSNEHVILFAKEDVCAGEELCYDYRFASEQRLPCNCGAVTCRGYVNEPGGGGAEGRLLRVPLSELRPLKPSDFWQDT